MLSLCVSWMRRYGRRTVFGVRIPGISRVVFLVGGLLLSGVARSEAPAASASAVRLLGSARHGHYNLHLLCLPAAASRPVERIDVSFGVGDTGSWGRLIWEKQGLELRRVSPAGESELFRAATPLPAIGPEGLPLEIRCREHLTEIIAAGKRLCRVATPGLGKGRILVGTSAGTATAKLVRIQRVEPVVFGDDFMRTEEEAEDLGLWRPLVGTWKLYSVMERIEANPDARIREGHIPDAGRSPNPFCLSGHGVGGAVIMTGQPFWSDYDFSVSIRSFKSDFGLVFAAVDAKEYWLVRWSLHSLGLRSRPVELVRVRDGRERVLAAAEVTGRAESWYRLGVRLTGNLIRVLVDDVPVLTYRDPTCTGGKIGLYARGGYETYFDDVDVRGIVELDPESLDGCLGADRLMQPLRGRWAMAAERSGDRLVGERDSGWWSSPGLLAVGWREWSDQCLETTLADVSEASAGVALALRSPRDYVGILVHGGRRPGLRLTDHRGGKESVLADMPLPGIAKGPVRLGVDTRDGLLQVRVNDVLRLRSPAPRDLSGRVGLVTCSKVPVVFSGLHFFCHPRRDWEHPVQIERFADDPYMQGWASPRYAWIRMDKNTSNAASFPRFFRHTGDFYGAFRIRTPVQDGLALFFGCDTVDPAHGYSLELQVDPAKQRGTIILSRRQHTLARASFTPSPKRVLPGQQIVDEKIGALPKTPDTVSYGELELWRDGHMLWASIDGKQLFSIREENPLTGRAVGMRIAAPMDFLHVGVQRGNIKDYLFDQAAVDWLTVGNWEVTNRFACDPRWSHMNGRGKGVSALWSKFEFSGDYTIEYYAGMRMRQGDMMEGAARMYYPRVGDIDIALNTRDQDLFSGYNVLIAAWDPMWQEKWTQFRRLGTVMARTDIELIPRGRIRRPKARAIPVEWDPGGRPVHGAWYFVKVRKTGPRYDVSFDNVPVFSVTDPDPLTGKRLALWTQHNSIVVARVKVGYRRARKVVQHRPLAVAAAVRESVPVAAAVTAPAPIFTLPSHPGFDADFEQDLDEFRPWDSDQSVELSLVPRPHGTGRALRLENLHGGGDVGVRLPVRGLDLGRSTHLDMDMAVGSGTRINLYLAFEDYPAERCFVHLTGPENEGPNMVRLDTVPGLRDDGSWHHVSLDLGAIARWRFPARASYRVAYLMLGMLHEGYLNAGLGGNPAGAVYWLDNVRLSSAGPADVALEWEGDSVARLRYHVWLDREKTSPMPKRSPLVVGPCTLLTAPGPGTWFVHAALADAPGAKGVFSRRLRVGKPLRIERVDPAADTPWGGNRISLFFSGKDGHPDWIHGSLRVGGREVPLNGLTTRYDPEHRRLDVTVCYTGPALPDGGEVPLTFSAPDTLRGTAPIGPDGKVLPLPMDLTFAWKVRMDYARDRVGPRVELTGALPRDVDFNAGLGRVSLLAPPEEARLRLCPHGDGRALRLENAVCGSAFNVDFGFPAFSLGNYARLRFDYRVNDTSRCDFMFRVAGQPYTLGFTDGDDSVGRYLGRLPDIRCDAAWHRVDFDLSSLRFARRRRGLGTLPKVTQFGLGDWVYPSNPPGAWVELDNLRFVPVAGTVAKPLVLTWEAFDPSGIRGYSYQWDNAPDTVPDTVVDSKEGRAEFRRLPEGEAVFHVRACDGAGRWGPPRHFSCFIDNTPPAMEELMPRPDEKVAAERIAVRFAESLAGIDPSGAVLSVNGRKCSLRSAACTWDPESRIFAWNMLSDWSLLRGEIPDGKEMQVRLSGIADYAGNEMEPLAWKWIVDYSRDATGPGVPRLWGYSSQFALYDHFDSGEYLQWREYGGRGGRETELDIVPRDGGGSCLRFRKVGGGRRFGIYRSRGSLGLDRYPFFSFDYRIMPGTHTNLLLYIDRQWYQITMTGERQHPEVGRIEDAADDGVWRHAFLDLRKIVAESLPDLSKPKVRLVAFADWHVAKHAESTMYIDNTAFLGPSCPVPLARISAADGSGISAFRTRLSMNPVDEPLRELSSPRNAVLLDAIDKPGLWYIHIQARDGAGNWGRILHFPYYCTQPVPEVDKNGYEDGGKWRVNMMKRRGGQCLLYTPQTPGGNDVLAAQFVMSQPTEVEISRRCSLTLDALPTLEANVFLRSRRDMKIAPCVRVTTRKGKPGKLIVGKAIALVPGEWRHGLHLTFPAQALDKLPRHVSGESIRFESMGVMAYPGRKSRDLLLLDQIMINGTLPARGT